MTCGCGTLEHLRTARDESRLVLTGKRALFYRIMKHPRARVGPRNSWNSLTPVAGAVTGRDVERESLRFSTPHSRVDGTM